MTEQTHTIEHIDPNALTIAPNIRLNTQLDKHFIASIRERGVQQAIDAYRAEDGTVTVLAGQRRTLAAREAGAATVPVLVRPAPPAEADRLVDQWVENEHRAALTGGEKVAAIEQMTLEGLSVHQIAKRTATAKPQVEAATKVAASETAKEAVNQMSLEEAAVLAEFEDDETAVQRLTQAAGTARFVHVAERQRQQRQEDAEEAAAAEELAGQGLTVVERPNYYTNGPTQPLNDLLGDEGERLDPEDHAANCPGHVVWVDWDWRWDDENDDEDEDAGAAEPQRVLAPGLGCADPTKHGHRDRWSGRSGKKKVADMTDEEREEAKTARQHVIQSNKDWQACTTVRREWLAETFAKRKTAPKGAEAYLARQINGHHSPRLGRWTVLGMTREGIEKELATATPKRALLLAVALYVASWEESTGKDTWRNEYEKEEAVPHLTLLSEWGYPLSEIEERMIAEQADAT